MSVLSSACFLLHNREITTRGGGSYYITYTALSENGNVRLRRYCLGKIPQCFNDGNIQII